ncbi:methyltransferase domain-containing protein [Candidatus Woesearchaeota archaeon]|jgi:ubiquinone/menaquinone biosynthesis C-methylase UbiE|nr:methyltransferase domain-containing protein [Candidatus Woesearchaeota archaeon]
MEIENWTELEKRIKLILNEVGFFPSKKLLETIPYWQQILAVIQKDFGGLDSVYSRIGKDYFQDALADVTEDQYSTRAQFMEMQRMINGDCPGGRKTLPAIVVKYDIEQHILDGEKLKTLVVCPGYIIPSWEKKIKQYTDGTPKIVRISSEDRVSKLEDAAQDDTDFVLVSYDMIFRQVGGNLSDPTVKRAVKSRVAELKQEGLSLEDAILKLEEQGESEEVDIILENSKSLNYALHKIAQTEIKSQNAERIFESLHEIFAANDKPYYMVMDEFHNSKNPAALRSQAIKSLAINADYLMLLSGTKTPNSFLDIAYAMTLLDPVTFGDDGERTGVQKFMSAVNNDPTIVNRLYDIWEKKPRLQIKDVCPDLEVEDHVEVRCSLRLEELMIYTALASHKEFEPNEKLLILRYALMDLRKIDTSEKAVFKNAKKIRKKLESFYEERPEVYQLIQREKDTPSTKYARAKELLEERIRNGDATLVFTSHTECIHDPLVEFLGAARTTKIDGEVTKGIVIEGANYFDTDADLALTERDIQILEFQTNPDKFIALTSYGKLREGRSLVKANNVLRLQREYRPGWEEQGFGRTARPGQTKPRVTGYDMLVVGSVEEGITATIARKARGIIKSESAHPVTQEEKASLMRNRLPENEPEIKARLDHSHAQIVNLMSGHMLGKGVNFVQKYLNENENALIYATNYNEDWETSYSAQCARVQEQLIKIIRSRQKKKFKNIADIACGPAVISRTLGRDIQETAEDLEEDYSVTCLDINEYQLKLGQLECELLGITNNKYVQGTAHDLSPIKDNSIDLSVYSLGFHYGHLEDGEREQCIRELNRITEVTGTVMIALPANVLNDNNKPAFIQGLTDLGFIVDQELSGTYEATKTVDAKSGEVVDGKKFKTYVLVAYKERDITELDKCSSEAFILNEDIYYSKPSQDSDALCGGEVTPGEPSREVCTEFYNLDTHTSLADLLAGMSPEEKNALGDIQLTGTVETLDDLAGAAIASGKQDELLAYLATLAET